MIRVEPLHRPPLPDWAIWSFMAGLYFAAGYEGQVELAIVNLMAVTRLMHQGEN